jgi:anti-anti-sigma factor
MMLTQPTSSDLHTDQLTLEVTDPLDVSMLHQFWIELQDAAAHRPRRLVVDLSACVFLDAQAIRLLLDIHQLIWLQDGRLVLRGAQPAVTRLLGLAGVLKVFAFEDAAPLQAVG